MRAPSAPSRGSGGAQLGEASGLATRLERLERERSKWRFNGSARPPHAEAPGPGQESVWDYPRPPRVEPVSAQLVVEFAGATLADTRRALRVVETSSPPVYYLPPSDVALDRLETCDRHTFCEWKGVAEHLSVRVGDRQAVDAAWRYRDPDSSYASIRDYIAFYAGRVDDARIDGVPVTPQPGDFYGGWITADLVGPYKGEPGSENW
ncbi:MAG: DUF427 domain-containing protein [Myxococcales bacterium]|nr:DUF427 domain-containing protein [Myxococcales bacterium]